jgi:hypothetical protein
MRRCRLLEATSIDDCCGKSVVGALIDRNGGAEERVRNAAGLVTRVLEPR